MIPVKYKTPIMPFSAIQAAATKKVVKPDCTFTFSSVFQFGTSL